MDQVTKALAGGEYESETDRSSERTRKVLVKMSRQEMDWVMAQPKPERRKLLFIIFAFYKPHCNKISRSRFAKMTGVSPEIVKRALAEMVEQGIIWIRKGRAKTTGSGGFHREPNAYYLVSELMREVVRQSDSGFEFDICELGKRFSEIYNGAIHESYTSQELRALLSPIEISKYVLWLNGASAETAGIDYRVSQTGRWSWKRAGKEVRNNGIGESRDPQ